MSNPARIISVWNLGPVTIPRRGLVLAGMAMAGLLALAAFLQRFSSFTGNRVVSEPFWWLFAGGMLACYWFGYRSLQSAQARVNLGPVIVLFPICFCLLALLISPVRSIDLSGYINIGWLQHGYQANPYVTTLAEIPGGDRDPMFRLSNWQWTPCAYGFLFCRIASVLCQSGQWNLAAFLFRAICVLVFLGAGWIVARGSKLLGGTNSNQSLFLFLWNPFLLMMFTVEGHNDLWMGLCTALSLFFAVAGTRLPVIPCLVLAVLLKHYALIALPFVLLFMARRFGWRKTAVSSILGLLLGMAIAWPYLVDLQKFQIAGQLANAGEAHNSLVALLYFPFEVGQHHFHWPEAWGDGFLDISRAAGLFGIVGFAVILAWRRFRGAAYDGRELVRDAVLLHFVLICLVTPKFYGWYLGMFFPLVLWLPAQDWLRRVVLAISCTQLLSLTFIDQTHVLNVLVMLVLPLVWGWRYRPLFSPSRSGVSEER
jgi:hypothetical protein